jgi:hypothetical protein
MPVLLVLGCDGHFAVDGRVLDGSGRPIAGATVARGGVQPHPIVTDARGCFHLSGMCSFVGHDELLAISAPGYQRYAATLRGPGRIGATFVLAPEGGPGAGAVRMGEPADCRAGR